MISTPILATKLYIPSHRSKVVPRQRLIERLNDGLYRKLTLISAPAGFGKTTLVSEWVTSAARPTAWLSLDEGDNDPARFLTYLIAALRTVAGNIGESVLGVLQSPQPPSIDSILTTVINEIAALPNHFMLVLDDYHVIDSRLVDQAVSFLLEHLPSQLHLVIATREDPQLPLARLRARGQLTEVRVTDLRFTLDEAAEFLNQAMRLNLSADDIAALEARTEGWIAGLQLASISMQGHQDTTHFIKSFTGSHHFVMDYLLEEVLHQQPENVQKFLLHTSLLSRLCGPLCDALLLSPAGSGQATLAYLERANLFIIPLDNERRWYRYHHLFADLLRQRFHQNITAAKENAESLINQLHIRASQWYEDNDLKLEAFQHAAAAQDIDRAERLIEGDGIPRHFRGAVMILLDWLGALPESVMNARPWLRWRYAGLLLVNGQTSGVDEKLQAAEAALQGIDDDEEKRHLTGLIATARATLALTRYQVEFMLTQSRRALEYLPTSDLTHRATANWTMGLAYGMMGDRATGRQSLTEAISLAQAGGDVFITLLATIGLGNLQEYQNQLHTAAETYRRVLGWAGDQPLQIISEAHLGLARILYEWNDLDAAEQYGKQSLHLSQQYDRLIDRFLICEMFLVRLKLARGDLDGAIALLDQISQTARQKNFIYRIPEIAALQVMTLLHQGKLSAAAQLAQTHPLPFTQVRLHLAQGNPSEALAILATVRQQAEAKDWKDERLKVMVLQAIAHQQHGEPDQALQVLGEALAAAEPEGFIRTFVDEGEPMAQLLAEALRRGITPGYTAKLLAQFSNAEVARMTSTEARSTPSLPVSTDGLIDALTQRELEILRLIADGRSNTEISERLFLALSTVKGYNRTLFDKLGVQRRTEAVARARELGLL